MKNIANFAILVSLIGLFVLSACSHTPIVRTMPEKNASLSRIASVDTNLGQYLQTLGENPQNDSAVTVLRSGMEAFLARALLIKAAEDTLDLQYYIWKKDTTGQIITSLLLEAADRGVRVRLLLDDLNTSGKDDELLTLNKHENIEVRLFNPFSSRKRRLWNFFSDFTRLNHRMHNKLFIADGQFAIIGGRNIGDEYFQASSQVDFEDIDLLATGQFMPQAGTSFDHYWNSQMSYPADSVIDLSSPSYDLQAMQQHLYDFRESQRDSVYARALTDQKLFRDLLDSNVEWFWGQLDLLYDDVGKTSAPGSDTGESPEILAQQLKHHVSSLTEELLIISPYFVPDRILLDTLAELRTKGVRIIILTNSLASTDVSAVHAGYQKYRKPLLNIGVELYELNATREKRKHRGKLIEYTGSSRASLHAKTYVFDRKKLFIGSLNLDPRSVYINTEIGLLVENAELASLVTNSLEDVLESETFRLGLTKDASGMGTQEQLTWSYIDQGETITTSNEPGVSVLRAISVWLLSLLPIDDQL